MVKELPANVGGPGDEGSIPGSGKSPVGGNRNPLQCSCLENPMNKGAWQATVHGVTELDMTYRLNHQSINVQICKEGILRKDCFFHHKMYEFSMYCKSML